MRTRVQRPCQAAKCRRWAAPALDGYPGHGTWYTRTVFATSPICPGSRRCRSASRRSAERVLQRRPRARLGAGGETRRSSAIAAHRLAPLTADAARLADKLRGPVERVARPGRQVCPSLATGQCRRSTRAVLIVQRSWFMSRSACASRPTLAEFLVQACVPRLSPKTVSVGARAPCERCAPRRRPGVLSARRTLGQCHVSDVGSAEGALPPLSRPVPTPNGCGATLADLALPSGRALAGGEKVAYPPHAPGDSLIHRVLGALPAHVRWKQAAASAAPCAATRLSVGFGRMSDSDPELHVTPPARTHASRLQLPGQMWECAAEAPEAVRLRCFCCGVAPATRRAAGGGHGRGGGCWRPKTGGRGPRKLSPCFRRLDDGPGGWL